MKFSFFVFKLCYIWSTVKAQFHPQSPCPGIFSYEGSEPEQDHWYGVILVSTDEALVGVRLDIRFDRPAQLLVSWMGEVTSNNNERFTILSLTQKLLPGPPLSSRFMVKYSPARGSPQLRSIRLNGRQICPPDPNFAVTLQNRPEVTVERSTRRPDPDFENSFSMGGHKPPGSVDPIVFDHQTTSTTRGYSMTENTNQYNKPVRNPPPPQTPSHGYNQPGVGSAITTRRPSFGNNEENNYNNPGNFNTGNSDHNNNYYETQNYHKHQGTSTTTESYNYNNQGRPNQNNNYDNYNNNNYNKVTTVATTTYTKKPTSNYNSNKQHVDGNSSGQSSGNYDNDNYNNNNNNKNNKNQAKPSQNQSSGGSSSSNSATNNNSKLSNSNQRSTSSTSTTTTERNNNKRPAQRPQSPQQTTEYPGSTSKNSNSNSGNSYQVGRTTTPKNHRDETSSFECGVVDNSITSGSTAAVPLITNGQQTARGQWPWHIALYKIEGINLSYVCGGTLVSLTAVITAAHCVTKKLLDRPVDPDVLVVYLGKYHLYQFSDDGGVQNKQVKDVYIHPDYNSSNFLGDIAVLILSSPVEYTSYVRPCCLWKSNSSVTGKEGTVVGWGYDENDRVTEELKMAKMPVVSRETCIYSYPDFFSRFTSNQTFCAGFRRGTTVCNGDSGGGMVFNQDSRWYLRGLVSITVAREGHRVCDTNHYVIFTDVAEFSNWLDRHLT